MQPAAAALIVAASVNLTLPSAARAEATPPYRAKRLLLGCWTHTAAHISQQGFHGSTARCFQEGRAIGGVFFESSGHGGDVCERWRIDAQRVVIWDYGDRRQGCLYALSRIGAH